MPSNPAPTATGGRDEEELVGSHLPLVGHLVRDVLYRVPSHVNRDDLVSAGMTALVLAARSFDAARGVPFAKFAATRIRGALIDELRSMDWASRSVRNRARQVESVRIDLTTALGRTPEAAEVAAALGVSPSELDALEQDVQRAGVLSLQGFAPESVDGLVPDEGMSPEQLIVHRERIGYLHHAIAALPERLRYVVQGYFFENRPMSELAAELGVTESRISQLRAEALAQLRDGMNSQLDPALERQSAEGLGTRVAARRQAYYAKIAATTSLRSRLSLTTPLGEPVEGTGALG